MELLLVVIGISLIAVGLFFAVGGFAGEEAGAGARTFTLQGPAWLVLVGIGVALLVFASVQDFDDVAGPVDDPPPSSTTATTTATTATTATTSSGDLTTTDPPPTDSAESGCVVSIENPLVSLRETPDPFGQEILRVPKGQHPVLEFTNESFAGVSNRWLKLSVDGQEGWVEDSTILIASKSGCSF